MKYSAVTSARGGVLVLPERMVPEYLYMLLQSTNEYKILEIVQPDTISGIHRNFNLGITQHLLYLDQISTKVMKISEKTERIPMSI